MPVVDEASDSGTSGADYRMVAPAAAAWAFAAVAVVRDPAESLAVAVLGGVAAAVAAYRGLRMLAITLLVVAATCGVVALRLVSLTTGPVADLADEGAAVRVTLDIVGDPRPVESSYGDMVVVRARVTRVEGRGIAARTREPVVVFAGAQWATLRLGESVSASGVLQESDSSNEAGILKATSQYRVIDDPAWWWDAAARMRSAVTESVSTRSDDVAGLVPALVHGDDRALPDRLAEDFRTSGLTHLLAVSGTNLTLVIGFLLFVARHTGVRGRGQILLGVAGTIGFVLLARPEPSVVRAAAMGLVALAGLGAGGTRRGMRSLCWAVVGLLLLDPWLARTVGFILSVCATTGILVLVPPWRDRLARWMPYWCAEAVAVPMAAQLACTPVVAVVSQQVSLVAVAANLLVAPAVGPATVLGLIGGLVALGSDPASHLVGWATGLFGGWIVLVGHRAAALPGAAVDWAATPLAIVGLTALCLLLVGGLGWGLGRPLVCVPAAVLVAGCLVRPISIGWPPPGWVMVMCDVGQGDASVLNAGDGQAVVVDTGPEPRAIDRCLSALGVERIPLVVLTHAHADHVDGLAGVLDGRAVGEVGVSGLGSSPYTTAPVVRMQFGQRQSVGDVAWTVLAPAPGTPDLDPATDDGTTINNTSVVLLADVGGVRILLTGDIEPDAQAALLRDVPGLEADVLKVPHHGSASQTAELFEQIDAGYALVSVGADNDYGHPAPQMLSLAERNSMRVVRTDQSGDVAVVSDDGEVAVVTR
ncbi:MAG: ComEC/Rec2 family competence protein [Nocardioidaceae bacterium]